MTVQSCVWDLPEILSMGGTFNDEKEELDHFEFEFHLSIAC